MIPRTLVPLGSQLPPADATATQRRRPTTLDERTLVPSMLPIVQLDGKSNIPKSLPLESVATRVVVPRDINQEAYNVQENTSVPVQPTDMDARVVMPQGAAAPLKIEAPTVPPADLVDLDVFMTGEVNLLVKPQTEQKARWELVTRVSSVAFHAFLIIFILMLPKIFPPHVPTQQEIDLANRQLTWIPPESSYAPKPKPASRPADQPAVHVNPKVINKVAPPVPQPVTKPDPVRPKTELPDAPMPKPQTTPPDMQTPAPKPDAPKAPLKLDTPDMPTPQPNLKLPRNNTVQDSIRDAMKQPSNAGGGRTGAVIGPGPRTPGSPGGGGGQGHGSFGNGYEILTPTEGVDFHDYMERVIETIRRNWYAVMPQSAMLGERGRVLLRFRINADGSVPRDDPSNDMSSGKEPLDRAAISSIRSSNPFEPLPSAFHGPFIEIRIMYLYNLPLEDAYK
ncbi:MAG: TonB family protein [Candidatus Acidiferrum sp.]|jgi:TonB family protein